MEPRHWRTAASCPRTAPPSVPLGAPAGRAAWGASLELDLHMAAVLGAPRRCAAATATAPTVAVAEAEAAAAAVFFSVVERDVS